MSETTSESVESEPSETTEPSERPKSKLPPGAVPAAGLISLSQIQNNANELREEDDLPPQLRKEVSNSEKEKGEI